MTLRSHSTLVIERLGKLWQRTTGCHGFAIGRYSVFCSQKIRGKYLQISENTNSFLKPSFSNQLLVMKLKYTVFNPGVNSKVPHGNIHCLLLKKRDLRNEPRKPWPIIFLWFFDHIDPNKNIVNGEYYSNLIQTHAIKSRLKKTAQTITSQAILYIKASVHMNRQVQGTSLTLGIETLPQPSYSLD